MNNSKKLDNNIPPRIGELTEEQENSLEKNLVWIFGARRSGTTWLGQLLSHNTVHIYEPTLSDHLAIQMHPGQVDSVRRIDGRSEHKNYFFANKYKNTWIYYLRKLILYRIYAQIQDHTKKIIIKEPISWLDSSDLICECLPNSKKIILLRDGRDIIDSLIDSRRKGGWVIKTEKGILKKQDQLRFVETRAKYWIKQMENLLNTYENNSKDNIILVKYEDLRKNTFETIFPIYKFLKIEISENDLNKIIYKYSYENIPEGEKGQGKFVRFASPGKWKENFTHQEIDITNKIMGETLKSLGYNKN